jgi:hypothetical protein
MGAIVASLPASSGSRRIARTVCATGNVDQNEPESCIGNDARAAFERLLRSHRFFRRNPRDLSSWADAPEDLPNNLARTT